MKWLRGVRDAKGILSLDGIRPAIKPKIPDPTPFKLPVKKKLLSDQHAIQFFIHYLMSPELPQLSPDLQEELLTHLRQLLAKGTLYDLFLDGLEKVDPPKRTEVIRGFFQGRWLLLQFPPQNTP